MKHNEHACEWQQVDSVGECIIGLPVPNDAMSAPPIPALAIPVLMICANALCEYIA
ncbi:MAG: hypothetical protein WA364_00865 [Candidatus Nitrosopolaris sp.]